MLHLPSRIRAYGQNSIRVEAMEDSGGRQPDAGTERFLLQGYLLKRSETLRRWNKRWFSLDPTTAKMEYRSQRSDLYPRGQIVFDASSTITVSPINFNSGAKQYDGCCLYIGTPRKKDYFLAAETPAAARAWVTALRAAMQVLKAHRDAVNAIGDAERRRQSEGAVRAAATASSATAQAMAKEIQAASQMSVLQGFGLQPEDSGQADDGSEDGVMDGTTIMKETLRVKDEELAQMAHDLRARDATIREMADRLSETAEAAEAAAAAAMQMDRDRKAAVSEAAQARRLADSALKEAEARIKEAQEGAARKVKEIEASREEAVYRAMEWKAEADRAHEKARALELALRQAQAATAAADVKTGSTDTQPTNVPEPQTTSADTADVGVPPKRDEATDDAAPTSGESTPAKHVPPAVSGPQNGSSPGSLERTASSQQPAETRPETSPSEELGAVSAPEEPSEAPGGMGEKNGDLPAADVGGQVGHEVADDALEKRAFPQPGQGEVLQGATHHTVAVERSGQTQGNAHLVDDVLAMDDGFLAAFRQGSLGSQPKDGKPDGTE